MAWQARVGGGGRRSGDNESWLPFRRIAPGNADRKEEAGAGNYTHCPKAAHAVAMAAPRAQRAPREPVPPLTRCTGNQNLVFCSGALRLEQRWWEITEGRNQRLTGDHLLGIVRLHVTIVLPESLSLPLLSGLLCIKWVCVILKNNDLDKEIDF